MAMRELGERVAAPVAAPMQETGPLPPARVLVVDDDDRNLLTISEVLKDVGKITLARSGEEALRHLLKDDFAVILLDVLMPGLDGYQTAGLIRQRESSKSTPIIFLTAINKEDAHMLRGYDAGAVDFLFKPFDPIMLRSKVAIFVELFQKTREIRQKAALEQRLLESNLKANAEKLQAERELRKAEERQEAILRTLPICLHSRSVKFPFRASFVSGAVERMTGFPPERFQERDFGLERVHPDDLRQVEEALAEGQKTGSYACQFRWRCADGNYRYFLDQGVVTHDEHGEPIQILGTLLDITDRRQLEDQLIHAQKLDAIGKLTGGVAHDFNNLLASILSGLSLIERQVEMNDKARRIFDMTEHAAKQGADLIARLLTFSRRQQLNPTVVSFQDLQTTLDPLLVPVLGGRIQLRWASPDDHWHALADRGQLEMALMNLVINARDAMPNGGTITLRALKRFLQLPEADVSAGHYVVLQVEDTGTGIAPEQIEKVLEPFYTTKEMGKGTGLGLSSAYGFARQSDGTLRIKSIVGKGTTVQLWLKTAQQAAVAATVAPVPPQGPLSFSDKSVLLVDDNKELRELTSLILSDLGMSVVCAAGGVEALALIEREPDRYDLIVTDFAMPIVSGVDLIKKARSIRSSWPCVLVTGYADGSVIAEKPNDVPLLHKPFDPNELTATIADIFRVTEVGGGGR